MTIGLGADGGDDEGAIVEAGGAESFPQAALAEEEPSVPEADFGTVIVVRWVCIEPWVFCGPLQYHLCTLYVAFIC